MELAIAAQAVTKRLATKGQAWKNLATHFRKVRDLHLRQLFAEDPKRGKRMTAEAVGIFFDYSKNRITDETLQLLIQLAKESGLRKKSTLCFAVTRSTSQKTAQSCIQPCEPLAKGPSCWMGKMSCRCARNPRQDGGFL